VLEPGLKQCPSIRKPYPLPELDHRTLRWYMRSNRLQFWSQTFHLIRSVPACCRQKCMCRLQPRSVSKL
jgi:hypothetical protein